MGLKGFIYLPRLINHDVSLPISGQSYGSVNETGPNGASGKWELWL